MTRSPLLALIPFLTAATLLPAAEDFKVIAHYPIGGEVRFDYLRADSLARRLYVSHSTQVDVLNSDTGAVVGVIAPMKGVHGIALVPSLQKGFITSGGDRTVVVFDMKSLKVLKVIGGLGVKPDAIEYDPETAMIYVANGESGGVTVIDPKMGEITANVPITGKLEGMAFDGAGRLFVNTEDKSEIQVIDTHTLKALAQWSLSPVEGGTGLAIDPKSHRLFSAGANGMLAVVDSDTGAVVATPPIGEDPDGDAFDPATGLIYTSGVGGTVSVLREEGANTFSVLQTVTTAPGARTITLDSKSGHVFLATGKYMDAPAPTADNPHPRRQGIPGSFEVLVVGR